MNKNCFVDFMTNTIFVTKKFYKAAQMYGTEEFYVILDLQEKLPSYRIRLQFQPKRNPIPYPTYEQMRNFIQISTDDMAAVEELYKTIHLARVMGKGYNLVRKWFMERYGADYVHEHFTDSDYYPAV